MAIKSRNPRAGFRTGQVMVLTVLALGGTILGATTIAGLLMLYQLRQTTDMANSAKAIFAADAGMEKSFYDIFCGPTLQNRTPCPSASLQFGNGSSVAISCYDAQGNQIKDSGGNPTCSPADGTAVARIRTVGHAGNSDRAFETNF